MILLEFKGGWELIIAVSLMAFPIVGIPASIMLYFLRKNETNKKLGHIWLILILVVISLSIIGLYLLSLFKN
jgi:hypothetical protein